MFKYTTAIRKLRKLKSRIRVVPGGTSAGKTYGIIPQLIDVATKRDNVEISVVSESIPHLRRGALKDFIKIMKETSRWVDSHYNKTLLTYTFSTGSYIEFFSADEESKVKGPRRDILYINECDSLTFATYHQMAIRTNETIWLDFNPAYEFWAHAELSDDPDATWLTLTYKDNEGLSDAIVKDIEKAREKAKTSSYWENWWKVYGLGQLGMLEGVVFDNWDVVDSIPREVKLIGRVIDFGFTNDPTVILSAYRHTGVVIWDEEVYETGLMNGDIAKILKRIGARKSDLIVADSSEPKSIKEINQYGFNVRGAVKGPDSIIFGIGVLQENDFLVTRRSINVIKELRRYAWDVDKNGKTLNKPIDIWNHAIDAMRYLATYSLPKHKKKRGLKRRN